MNTVWLLVQREFSVRVRARGYLFITIIGLLAIVGLAFAPAIIQAVGSGSQLTLAVVDRTGHDGGPIATGSVEESLFFKRLQADLVDRLPNGKTLYQLSTSDASPADLDAQVNAGRLDGYILISAEVTGSASGSSLPQYRALLVSKDSVPDRDLARLSAAVSSAATYVRLDQRGLSGQQADELFAPVVTQTQVLSAAWGKSEADRAQAMALTYVLVLLLYMTVAVYGSYVALGVIEEKSSRVIEILVSTVRPFQLMLGKVLGVGLTALSQYAIWIVAGAVVLALRSTTGGLQLGGLELHLAAVSPGVLASFVVFFLLGFFTYAAIFAGAGSLVSRTEDAQQINTPVLMPLVVVFIVSVWAMGSPDAPLAVVLSMIPFASPIVMFVRISMGNPAAWQIAVAVIINAATIAVLVWVAAKVFRAAILLYGRRVSLRAVFRALR
jgi:ABC-2 type transport system permease protein